MERAIRDIACRKLRATISEFGQKTIDGAVIIGGYEFPGRDQIGGLEYIYSPTKCGLTLAKVEYKVARFFEDV